MQKLRTLCSSPQIVQVITRNACGGGQNKKGLVLGCYSGCSPGEFKLTKEADSLDQNLNGKLSELLKGGTPLGQANLFTNLSDDWYGVAVGGLGEEGVGHDNVEGINACKENIRVAAGLAAIKLQEAGISHILVEGFTNPEAAAEGAALATWSYEELKSPGERSPKVVLDKYGSGEKDSWLRGVAKAEAQNLARYIEEVPANIMTPHGFAEKCIENLCPCGIQVDVHDKDWIETKGMTAFLTIAKTSCQEPLFVELKYCGADPNDLPVIFVGKGITYDTGGLHLKDKSIMSEYRADLAGAAVIAGAMRCIASMALPINVIGLIPVCENMIGGSATKPGDVVMALNGKTIRIDDPDNEGRVLLVDAELFSEFYKPCLEIAISTMTPGVKKTLGSSASAVVTDSKEVWLEMERAGAEAGDRFWNFPSFWKIYRKKITDYVGVDVSNVGMQPGNVCQAAAFLKEFVPKVDFAHIDITGTGMVSTGFGHPYLKAGIMSGRPTRSVAQFLYQLACPHETGDEC